MALLKTANTPTGFVAVNAYHRVEGIYIMGKDQMSFNIRAYKDVSLPHFSDVPVTCPYDIDGVNPFRQAYLYLKAQAGFKDAVDA
jgi:hypothetical protein